MDLDDLMPAKKSSGVMIGENLSTLSVAELAQRIKDLECGDRTRAARTRKKTQARGGCAVAVQIVKQILSNPIKSH